MPREKPPCLPIIMAIEWHPYSTVLMATCRPSHMPIIMVTERPPYLL
jgi:hypothetical protein